MSAQAAREVPLSTLAPKYLHSNSTSHTSAFSAIAELIDNAYDPDVSAKQFWIDKTLIKEKLCLTFMDNGNGLDHKTMQRMLSFGYSDKTAVEGHKPIGVYGNGFKSGSMRLGKDAIVFSRSKRGMCIGMLSQTYLEEIGAEQIQIPIVCVEERNLSGFSVRAEHRASLQDILRYSLFQTERELLAELDAITSSFSKEKTGTRIIIWNLRRTATDETEFDFETDSYDIRIPNSEIAEKTASYIPETARSLRAYCSILYLKPRMQMVLRGEKVKMVLIARSLASTKKDYYAPTFLEKQRVPITFGFNTKSKDQYGVMMYHKNRLIKAYERVGCQLRANNMGVGVIGIIECDFLEPMHNKQSFVKSDEYRLTINNLGKKLEDYCKEMQYRWKKKHPNSSVPVEETMKKPDQNWVCCDKCQKWRKIPDGFDVTELKKEWFCWMNPDNRFRSCDVEEEPEDDEISGYTKTYKQQEKEDKKKNEKTTQQSPSIPTTSKSVPKDAERADSRTSSTISQAAVSPPVTNVLPVISGVCSVSASSYDLRKRGTPSPLGTPKRPREGLLSRISGTLGERSTCSPSVPADVEDSDGQTTDIISTLEAYNTPAPANPDDDESNTDQEAMEEEYCTMNTLISLKEGKPSLAAERDETRSPTRSINFSAPMQAENPGGSAEPDLNFISEDRRSLIELRQNVWRLLLIDIPALEPVQIDYESHKIDDILKRHLDTKIPTDASSP